MYRDDITKMHILYSAAVLLECDIRWGEDSSKAKSKLAPWKRRHSHANKNGSFVSCIIAQKGLLCKRPSSSPARWS